MVLFSVSSKFYGYFPDFCFFFRHGGKLSTCGKQTPRSSEQVDRTKIFFALAGKKTGPTLNVPKKSEMILVVTVENTDKLSRGVGIWQRNNV